MFREIIRDLSPEEAAAAGRGSARCPQCCTVPAQVARSSSRAREGAARGRRSSSTGARAPCFRDSAPQFYYCSSLVAEYCSNYIVIMYDI